MKYTAIMAAAVACLLLAACSETPSPSTPKAATAENTRTTEADSLSVQSILYYFHRTVRCTECLSMEMFTEALVSTDFKNALEAGTLAYAVVNLDEPDNEHYADEFNLAYSTLVLVSTDASGTIVRWEELGDAWEKAQDQNAFQEYVAREITAWLAP